MELPLVKGGAKAGAIQVKVTFCMDKVNDQ